MAAGRMPWYAPWGAALALVIATVLAARSGMLGTLVLLLLLALAALLALAVLALVKRAMRPRALPLLAPLAVVGVAAMIAIGATAPPPEQESRGSEDAEELDTPPEPAASEQAPAAPTAPAAPATPTAPAPPAATTKPPAAPAPPPAPAAWSARPLWSLDQSSVQELVLGQTLVLHATGSDGSTVRAVAAGTGKELWTHHEPGIRVASMAGGEGLVVLEAGGRVGGGPWRGLVVLDAGDGSVLWRRTTDLAIGFPAVAAGRILTLHIEPDDDILLQARDARAGALLWSHPLGRDAEGARFAIGRADAERVLVTTHGARVLALDARSGAEAWSARVDDGSERMYQLVADAGSPLVLHAEEDHTMTLVALQPRDGAELWRAQVPTSAAFRSPVVASGLVVVPGHGHVTALRLADGTQAWDVWTGIGNNETFGWALNDTKVEVDGAHAFATQHVGAGEQAVTLAIRLADGGVAWRLDGIGSAAPPVAAGERVFVRNGTGATLVAIDQGTGTWTSTEAATTKPLSLLAAGDVLVAKAPGRVVAYRA